MEVSENSVKKMELSESSWNAKIGETKETKVTLTPSNSSSMIVAVSDKPSIATASCKDTICSIKANGPGIAVITIYPKDNYELAKTIIVNVSSSSESDKNCDWKESGKKETIYADTSKKCEVYSVNDCIGDDTCNVCENKKTSYLYTYKLKNDDTTYGKYYHQDNLYGDDALEKCRIAAVNIALEMSMEKIIPMRHLDILMCLRNALNIIHMNLLNIHILVIN